MALDLNAVRPRPDGKYSPELHRWLRREGRNKCGVFQRKIDPIFGEPTTAGVWSPSSILIGFDDDDGWILGNSLREIVLARARQRWAIPIGTEEGAIRAAEAMRIKKIAALKKQIAKLEGMRFGK